MFFARFACPFFVYSCSYSVISILLFAIVRFCLPSHLFVIVRVRLCSRVVFYLFLDQHSVSFASMRLSSLLPAAPDANFEPLNWLVLVFLHASITQLDLHFFSAPCSGGANTMLVIILQTRFALTSASSTILLCLIACWQSTVDVAIGRTTSMI